MWLAFETGGKESFRGERNARAGAREEGGKEMPARRPLFWPSRLLIMYPKLTPAYLTACHSQLAAMHNIFRAIFKTRNGEMENRNGEWGKGNGESLKRGILKSGNLYNGESLKAVSEISVACVACVQTITKL